MTSSSESESEEADEKLAINIAKFNRILQNSLSTSSITKLTILKNCLLRKVDVVDKIIALSHQKNELHKQKQKILQDLK